MMTCPICGSNGLETTGFDDRFHQFVCIDNNHPYAGGPVLARETVTIHVPTSQALIIEWLRRTFRPDSP